MQGVRTDQPPALLVLKFVAPRAESRFVSGEGIQYVCDDRRISLGHSFRPQRLGPHLRRWAVGEAVDPALPGLATVFRASGAVRYSPRDWE